MPDSKFPSKRQISPAVINHSVMQAKTNSKAFPNDSRNVAPTATDMIFEDRH